MVMCIDALDKLTDLLIPSRKRSVCVNILRLSSYFETFK